MSVSFCGLHSLVNLVIYDIWGFKKCQNLFCECLRMALFGQNLMLMPSWKQFTSHLWTTLENLRDRFPGCMAVQQSGRLPPKYLAAGYHRAPPFSCLKRVKNHSQITAQQLGWTLSIIKYLKSLKGSRQKQGERQSSCFASTSTFLLHAIPCRYVRDWTNDQGAEWLIKQELGDFIPEFKGWQNLQVDIAMCVKGLMWSIWAVCNNSINTSLNLGFLLELMAALESFTRWTPYDNISKGSTAALLEQTEYIDEASDELEKGEILQTLSCPVASKHSSREPVAWFGLHLQECYLLQTSVKEDILNSCIFWISSHKLSLRLCLVTFLRTSDEHAVLPFIPDEECFLL